MARVEDEWVHLYVEQIHAETEKAFLIEFEAWDGKFWIPKSQIADAADYAKGKFKSEECQMSITQWIAEQNGIDGDPNES